MNIRIGSLEVRITDGGIKTKKVMPVAKAANGMRIVNCELVEKKISDPRGIKEYRLTLEDEHGNVKVMRSPNKLGTVLFGNAAGARATETKKSRSPKHRNVDVEAAKMEQAIEAKRFDGRKKVVMHHLEAEVWLMTATLLSVDVEAEKNDLPIFLLGEIEKFANRITLGQHLLDQVKKATLNGNPEKNAKVREVLSNAETFASGHAATINKIVKDLRILSRYEAIQLRNGVTISATGKAATEEMVAAATYAVAMV